MIQKSLKHFCYLLGLCVHAKTHEVLVRSVCARLILICLNQFNNRWGPGKHLHNVVHNTDVAGGLWSCAKWIDKVGGRQKADELAAEEIHWHNDKKMVSKVVGMVGPDVKVKAPLFNLVRGLV
jgi:hypothetical protein